MLAGTLCAADAPKVDRLSPPGGQRGTTVQVNLIGKPGSRPIQVWSQTNQLAVEVADKKDQATIVIPADASAGIHWLRFCNAAGATELVPFDVGLVPELAETEPNDSVDVANPIEKSSVVVNGALSKSGEVDVFKIQLKANQTLVASMIANRLLGSPMDAVLQVLDADGITLAQNDDDHALDPQLAYTAKTSGTYYVRTFAFPSAPNSTIRLAGSSSYVYRMTITTDAFIDFAIPESVDGSSETKVELHGWNLSDAQKTTTVSPQQPASFVVNRAKASPMIIGRSEFLSLSETDAASADQLQPPFVVTGIIDSNDKSDAYSFSATKGQQLTVQATARQMYSQLDPVVRVLDSTGKVLKESDDISRENMDSLLAVSIPADGKYSIQIRDRFDSGGSRHFYRLSCQNTLPTVKASVANSSFVLSESEPLEIPITVTRQNGHKDAVTFHVVGLPAGIEAAAVVSESKGDTAKKVTLKLEVKNVQQPFSGPITIAGTAPQETICVTSELPNSSETTRSFWLTVIPKTPSQKAQPTAGEKS